MFVGREHELDVMCRLYDRRGFEMVVLYGRRRIGKTSLIEEFVKDKRVLFFTALQQSDLLNLHGFSSAIAEFYGQPSETPPFATWQQAFDYIAKRERESSTPMVLVFDEFPYAALANTSLPSVLQIAIDHDLKRTNVMLVLSGSNEGFMESKVLGAKSPLFGRRTAQIQLQPLSYLEVAKFLPNTPPIEQVDYYATFGGTPYYLSQLDESAGYQSNVINLCFDKLGTLYEEPMMLLREELREPAIYFSVMQAIANGESTPKAIAEHSGVEHGNINLYLQTLNNLGLIEKRVPFGEKPERSRRGMYVIKDPFFAYWFRFVGPNMGAVERNAGSIAARRLALGEAFATHVGQQFETICAQWLAYANAAGTLPFLATSFGKWWGSNPAKHEQTDIDVIAADASSKTILLGECKWRNNLDETETIEALRDRVGLVRGFATTHLAVFTKKPLSKATRAKYPELIAESVDDLYSTL